MTTVVLQKLPRGSTLCVPTALPVGVDISALVSIADTAQQQAHCDTAVDLVNNNSIGALGSASVKGFQAPEQPYALANSIHRKSAPVVQLQLDTRHRTPLMHNLRLCSHQGQHAPQFGAIWSTYLACQYSLSWESYTEQTTVPNSISHSVCMFQIQ